MEIIECPKCNQFISSRMNKCMYCSTPVGDDDADSSDDSVDISLDDIQSVTFEALPSDSEGEQPLDSTASGSIEGPRQERSPAVVEKSARALSRSALLEEEDSADIYRRYVLKWNLIALLGIVLLCGGVAMLAVNPDLALPQSLETVGWGLIFASFGLYAFVNIWFIYESFRLGIIYGILVVLLAPVGIILVLIKGWNEVRRPACLFVLFGGVWIWGGILVAGVEATREMGKEGDVVGLFSPGAIQQEKAWEDFGRLVQELDYLILQNVEQPDGAFEEQLASHHKSIVANLRKGAANDDGDSGIAMGALADAFDHFFPVQRGRLPGICIGIGHYTKEIGNDIPTLNRDRQELEALIQATNDILKAETAALLIFKNKLIERSFSADDSKRLGDEWRVLFSSGGMLGVLRELKPVLLAKVEMMSFLITHQKDWKYDHQDGAYDFYNDESMERFKKLQDTYNACLLAYQASLEQ